MVCQGLGPEQTQEVWEPFFDWVQGARRQDFELDLARRWAWDARSWWDSGQARIDLCPRHARRRARGITPGGKATRARSASSCTATTRCGCRRPCWRRSAGRRWRTALFAASRHQMVRLHISKGLAGAPDEVLRRGPADRDQSGGRSMPSRWSSSPTANGRPPIRAMRAPAIDLAAARRNAPRHRPGGRRTAQDRAGLGFLCLGEQLLQPRLAARILGRELSRDYGRSRTDIRSGRPVLRPSRRRQRRLERRRFYAPGMNPKSCASSISGGSSGAAFRLRARRPAPAALSPQR